MSEAVAQPDPSTVRDFPDRLPPMVVKELRQGLRARLFGETVAGFHLVLLVLIFPMLHFGQDSEVAGAQRLLWWIFSGVLVLLLPLRGLSALIQERRENTLDTLLLTSLSGGRIVWGKWLAIAAQIAVTGISLVPYTIILHAAGGISLTENLTALLRLGLLGQHGPSLGRADMRAVHCTIVDPSRDAPRMSTGTGDPSPVMTGTGSGLRFTIIRSTPGTCPK